MSVQAQAPAATSNATSQLPPTPETRVTTSQGDQHLPSFSTQVQVTQDQSLSVKRLMRPLLLLILLLTQPAT